MKAGELLLSGNELYYFVKKLINFAPCFADVAELVDAPDLGSGA